MRNLMMPTLRSASRPVSVGMAVLGAALCAMGCDSGGPAMDDAGAAVVDASVPMGDAAGAPDAGPDVDGSVVGCVSDDACDDGDRCTRDYCDWVRPDPMGHCAHEYFEGACVTYVDVSSGIRDGCGIDVDGRTFCWGGLAAAPSSEGPLYPVLLSPDLPPAARVEISPNGGYLSFTDPRLPTDPHVVESASDSGVTSGCIITRTGDVWCWPGCFDGSTNLAPVQLPDIHNAVDIDPTPGGLGFTVYVTTADGLVTYIRCTGVDVEPYVSMPVVGTGPTDHRMTTLDVLGGADRGGVWFFGVDDAGEFLAFGEWVLSSFDFGGVHVTSVSAGGWHASQGTYEQDNSALCYIDTAGVTSCLREDSPPPETVAGSYTRIEQSSFLVCGASADGHISCWGPTFHLGDPGTSVDAYFAAGTPRPVPELDGATDWSVSGIGVCGIIDGRIRCRDEATGSGSRYFLPWMD